jgi:hypothetical protein
MAVASRDDLVAYFGSLEASSLTLVTTVNSDLLLSNLRRETTLVEFDEVKPFRGSLPSRIVVHEDDVEDFFAWSTTFLESLRPLTAFVDVVSRRQVLERRRPPDLTSRQLQGLVASVLMDGLLQSKTRPRVPDAILPACQRTLSAVFYQTTLAGSTAWETSDAAGLWTAVRASLGSPDLSFGAPNILEFWAAMIEAVRVPETGDREGLIATIRRSSVASPREVFWTGTAPAAVPNGLDRFLKAPREERLRFVDDRISHISRGPGSSLEKSAFGGYLLSLVADGDFSLWSTAASYNDLPTLPLWFAFFTGVHERSNALVFAQSIGRRFMRLLSNVDEVDVDGREFLVGRRARSRGTGPVDFPLGSVNVMSARLGVGVRGWFSIREPVSSAEEPRRETREQTALRESTPGDASKKTATVPREVTEARNLAERIMLLLNPLVQGSRPAPPPTSRPQVPAPRPSIEPRPPAAQLFPEVPPPERGRGSTPRKTKRKT